MKKHIRSYNELILLDSFEDRFAYLNLEGVPCDRTFGGLRYLNQKFYTSSEWKSVRDRVIYRDNGCDLGILDRPLGKKVIVHHINPIDPDQLVHFDEAIIDENNLITCSYETHRALHYGDLALVRYEPIIRKPHDTCPWR